MTVARPRGAVMCANCTTQLKSTGVEGRAKGDANCAPVVKSQNDYDFTNFTKCCYLSTTDASRQLPHATGGSVAVRRCGCQQLKLHIVVPFKTNEQGLRTVLAFETSKLNCTVFVF